MGLALVGDVLSRPRPVGQRENRTSTRLSHGTTPTSRHLCRKVPWDQRENRTLTPLSHGTQHSERSSYHRSPVGRASKTDAAISPAPAGERPREAGRIASHGTGAGR